ncbi:MAG: hypothetical protein KIS85_05800 [Anaerolineales bacterium]|nr:hypothetical protein [Anaerolineales bacterium]
MPRIRCHYVDCVFLDEGYCAAASVELDPEEGCLTYSPSGDVSGGDVWDDDDSADLEEDWAEAGFGSEGEDDDDWDEDDADDVDDDD